MYQNKKDEYAVFVKQAPFLLCNRYDLNCAAKIHQISIVCVEKLTYLIENMTIKNPVY